MLQPLIENFWALKKEEVLTSLSSTEKGLSQLTANLRLKQYGPNTVKAGSNQHPSFFFYHTLKALLPYY